jgi:hypothetical protein
MASYRSFCSVSICVTSRRIEKPSAGSSLYSNRTLACNICPVEDLPFTNHAESRACSDLVNIKGS